MKSQTKDRVELQNQRLNALANEMLVIPLIIFFSFGFLAHQQIFQPISYYLASMAFLALIPGLILKLIMIL